MTFSQTAVERPSNRSRIVSTTVMITLRWGLSTQATVSAVIVKSAKSSDEGDDIPYHHRHHHHHHHQLRRLACDNGGLVVHWPADQLTAVLDRRHEAVGRGPAGVDEVRWSLPYVSAATTTTSKSTTPQAQPVVTVSLPVYSNRSQRSRTCFTHC